MNIWNRDLSTAPRDRKVWLASICGKVVGPTSWDAKREQWAGFATNGKAPIAWQPYEVPEHPEYESPRKAAEAESESHGDAVGRPTSERQAETLGSEDGGVTAGETATHFILDDVGGGA